MFEQLVCHSLLVLRPLERIFMEALKSFSFFRYGKRSLNQGPEFVVFFCHENDRSPERTDT
ncbi:MAG: hypothetical protein D6797_00040 [Bdellovibrio sp.]|nr:MAG: hypothetical protein D6797_00040 [Bdellovibrio sp.]